jgi:hypothetical protein
MKPNIVLITSDQQRGELADMIASSRSGVASPELPVVGTA